MELPLADFKPTTPLMSILSRLAVRLNIMSLLFVNRPVSSVVNYIAIGAGGLGFDSRADQIGRSIANGSPPLRRFFGIVSHVLSCGDGPRHSLHASA